MTAALIRQWHDDIAAGISHMQGAGKIAAGLDADRAPCWPVSRAASASCSLPATSRIWRRRSTLEAALDVGIESLRVTA
jgi:hypothetical protein